MFDIDLDPNQIAIQHKLNKLSCKLQKQESLNFFEKIFKKTPKINSLYIYGDVGRGKSMLMKDFYESLDDVEKYYVHFNKFMKEIHENLRNVRYGDEEYDDELIEATKRVIKKAKVICFDEFQVTDIGDAMLLGRIFSRFFENNITAICTSNTHPKDLYKDGLQRQRFMEFVDNSLIPNCEILHLDSEIDYRILYVKSIEKRFFLKNDKSDEKIKEIITKLTNSSRPKQKNLKIWGRNLKITKTYDNIAVFNLMNYAKKSLPQLIFRQFVAILT